jgi:hypothetical protein
MSMVLSVELFSEIVSSLRSDGTGSRLHDKRTQARVGLRCGLEVVPCSLPDKKAKPVTVHVHDLSVGGIGLVSPVELSDGSEFVARFSRRDRPAVPVLYRVRYCRQISVQMFSVGAMFQRALPDSTGEVLSIGRPKVKPRKHGSAVEPDPARDAA